MGTIFVPSSSQVVPPQFARFSPTICRYPFILLGGERHGENTTQCPRPGLEPGPFAPGTNALTMRPSRMFGCIPNLFPLVNSRSRIASPLSFHGRELLGNTSRSKQGHACLVPHHLQDLLIQMKKKKQLKDQR